MTDHDTPAPARRDLCRADRAYLARFVNARPLKHLTEEELTSFLFRARMYPSRSRFASGPSDWFEPRRDISVAMAIRTLRAKLEQAAASAELVAQLDRDYIDENDLAEDDEAVVVTSAVRDGARESLALLGIIELAVAMVGIELRPPLRSRPPDEGPVSHDDDDATRLAARA